MKTNTDQRHSMRSMHPLRILWATFMTLMSISASGCKPDRSSKSEDRDGRNQASGFEDEIDARQRNKPPTKEIAEERLQGIVVAKRGPDDTIAVTIDGKTTWHTPSPLYDLMEVTAPNGTTAWQKRPVEEQLSIHAAPEIMPGDVVDIWYELRKKDRRFGFDPYNNALSTARAVAILQKKGERFAAESDGK